MGRILNNGENRVQNALFDRWVSPSVTAGINSATETAELWNVRNGNIGAIVVDQLADDLGAENSYVARVNVSTVGRFQSFDQDIPFPQEVASQPQILMFEMKAVVAGQVFNQINTVLQNPNGTPTTKTVQIIDGSDPRALATTNWKRYWFEYTGWNPSGVTLGAGATTRLAFQFNAGTATWAPIVYLRNVRLYKLINQRLERVPFDRMAGRTLWPRMTTAQRTALLNVGNGYAVYDMTVPGLYVMDAGTWKKVTLV
jgi:hypothetical protein